MINGPDFDENDDDFDECDGEAEDEFDDYFDIDRYSDE